MIAVRPETKKVFLAVGRVAFVVAALVFGVWSITRNQEAVAAALVDVNPVRVAMALALVIVGLLFGAIAFSILLTDVGYRRSLRVGQMVFLVGSLGKYIPGSVWFLAAQADLAKRTGVPPRKAVTVGLLVVYWALLSAIAVGVLAAVVSDALPSVPWWIMLIVALLATAALVPRVVSWWARRLSGDSDLPRMSARSTAVLAFLFIGNWIANGLALAILVGNSTSDSFVSLFVIGTAGFALSFAAGLVMPLAPAGLGLREGALVLLLTPSVGVGPAVIAATIMRVLHLIGDFGAAGAAWLLARRSFGGTGIPQTEDQERFV